MSEHFVKYINIKRYKCFSDFSAEGFKRVNLISGRNNVGKTALMEALFINVNTESVQTAIQGLSVVDSLRGRVDRNHSATRTLESMSGSSGVTELVTDVNSVTYSYDSLELIDNYLIIVSGDIQAISGSRIKEVIKKVSGLETQAGYISSVGGSQKSIINSFAAVQKKDRESEVNEIIRSFDDSIESVKIIGGNSVQCKVTNVNGGISYRSIGEFGDGLRHYLSIIVDLFKAENTYLFIDELDSGIHYSSLDRLWEIIFTLSEELNVQVFATTHSRECIESYCRVAEKLQEKDISFITLVRNKEKAVKAIVRDYEVFTDSIHDDREVRGW